MVKSLSIVLLLLAACDVDDTNLGYSRLETPRTRWAITIPAEELQGSVVEIDSTGDVIGAGAFDGHGFITKRVASDGSERWTHRYASGGGQSSSYVSSVVVGADDSIVVTGVFSGVVDFGGQTLSGPLTRTSTFLVKYAANGDVSWLRKVDGTAWIQGMAVLIDTTGQIVVAGNYDDGNIVFAETTYAAGHVENSQGSGFLLALDQDGHERWAHVFDGAGAWFLESAVNGDLLVSGQLEQPTSVGGAVVTPPSRLGVFVSRFHPDGTFVASRAMGLANGTTGYGWLHVHPDGPIVVQTLDQPDVIPHQPAVMLRALDDDLQDLWQESYTDKQYRMMSSSIGLFGVTVVPSPYNSDHPETMEAHGELVRYDADGGVSLGEFGELLLGGVHGTGFRDGAANATGLAFIGDQTGTWDFGSGPVTGDEDVLIVALDSP